MRRSRLSVLALACAAAGSTLAWATPTITTVNNTWVVNNGAIQFTVNYSGAGNFDRISSVVYDGQQMLGSKGLYYYLNSGNTYLSNTATYSYTTGSNYIDISALRPADATYPVDITWHWILRDGDAGFSTYLTYHHTTAMAPWDAGENGYDEFFNEGLFDYSSINDNFWGYQAAGQPQRGQGRFTTAETSNMVGIPSEYIKSFETKYDWRDTHLREGGVTGIVTAANTSLATKANVATNYGAWNITNYETNESVNGGPFNPQSPWADGASMVIAPAGNHQGGPPDVTYTGNVDKAFAPQYTYFNKATGAGNTVNALRQDAEYYSTGAGAASLNAFYDSINLPYWQTAAQRGTVTGEIRLADGTSLDGATIVLSTFDPVAYAADPISQEQQRRGAGYNYWVSPNKDGTFSLPDVRPGTYRVTIVKPGYYREGTFDNITVTGGGTTNTGNLTWQPDVSGKGVFQVGTFDRTSDEFKDGDNYNNWLDTFNYSKEFPSGVNYTVNPATPLSDPTNDRNNWALDMLNGVQDGWKVNFNLAAAPVAGSTSTITLALAGQTFINRINVTVNGTTFTTNFDHSLDNASIVDRSGDTSGRVLYRKLTITGLKAGLNTITFDIGAGGTGQELQWDALRLDVQNPGTFSESHWNGGSGNWTDPAMWSTQAYNYTAINKSPGASILEDTSTTFSDGATQTAAVNTGSLFYDAFINGGTVTLNTSVAVQKMSLLEGTLQVTSGAPVLTVNDAMVLGGGTATGTGTMNALSTTYVNFANTIAGGFVVNSSGAVTVADGAGIVVTGAGSKWNTPGFSFGTGSLTTVTASSGGIISAGTGALGVGTFGALTLAGGSGGVNAGSVSNSGSLMSSAGNTIVLASTGTFTNSGTAMISGGLSGSSNSGTGVLNTGGTLVLNGTNTYLGATVVSGGLVQVGALSAIGGTGASVLVSAGGAIAYAPGAADGGFASFLARINPTSSGALAITSTDSAATLDFTSGPLAAYSSLALAAAGNVTFLGTYVPAGNLYRLGGGGNGSTLNFAPTITGAASVIIGNTASGGAVMLSSINSYTGTTTLRGGTLIAMSLASGGASSPLGASSNAASNLILDGGTLQFAGSSGGVTDRLFTLGPGGGTLDGSGSVGTTLVFNNTGAIAFSGSGNRTLLLTGSNGSSMFTPALADPASGILSLTKAGTGAWNLAGLAKTYSGDTTVSAGTLYLGSANVLPNGSGKGNLIIASGTKVDLNGLDSSINGLNDGPAGTPTTDNPTGWATPNGPGGGSLINSGSLHTLTLGGGNANGTFSGVISGALNIIKTGSGTQLLTGDNLYTGTTTIAAGTLQVGIGGTPSSDGAGDGGFTGKLGGGNIINNATLVYNRGYLTTVNNTISGTGSLKQIANAELALTATNTYTGSTTIGGGIANIGTNGSGLAFSGDCSIGAATLANGGVASSIGASSNAAANLILDGGTLFYSSTTSASTDRLFTVTPNGGALYFSGPVTMTNTGALAFSGTGDRTLSLGGDSTSGSSLAAAIGDPASGKTFLTKDRGITWTLTSAAGLTYSGDTTMLMGTLKVSPGVVMPVGSGKGNLVFGTSTDFSSVYPAIFELNGDDVAINGLSGGLTTSNYWRVDNNVGTHSFTLGNNNASAMFNGQLTGTLNLVKTGTGTQTLAGTSSYTGTTTISGGVLQLGAGGVGGSLGTGAVVDNASIVVNRTDIYTAANAISGSGTLTKLATGTLILTGSSSLTGTTTISAGTLQIGNTGATGNLGSGAIVNNAALVLARTGALAIPSAMSGSGTLTQVATGTSTLTGSNSYTGVTTISAGVLQIGSGSTTGTLGTGAVVDNAQLVFNRSNAYTAANAISGSGNISQIGLGTTILTGSNSYAGGTSVSAGILQFNSANAIGGTGANVTIGAAGVAAAGYSMDQAFINRIAPASGGVAALTASNATALDFSTPGLANVSLGALGNVTYSGTLTPAANTYRFGGGASGGQSLTVSSPLTGARAVIAGVSGQPLASAGVVILSASNNYSGATTLQGGELRISNASALPAGATLTLAANTKLTLTAGANKLLHPSALAISGATHNGAISATSAIDLADNDAILPLASYSSNEIRQLLLSGYAAGAWTGQGLLTSAASPLQAIGYADGATYDILRGDHLFDGITIAATDAVAKFTWAGDANLDGVIHLDDYAQIDASFFFGYDGTHPFDAAHPASWFNGDFNYDGLVNYKDYAMIDAAFAGQSGPLAAGPVAPGTTDAAQLIAEHELLFGQPYSDALAQLQNPAPTAPEPASLGLLLIATPALLKRRKNRRRLSDLPSPD